MVRENAVYGGVHVANCGSFYTFCSQSDKNRLIYVYGSVHRWSILIIVQRDAIQSSLFIILQVHSTCFGCQPQPSSGVHKTVTTASGTGHIFCSAASVQRDGDDDGCGWNPEHVEWTLRVINWMLCVASRWTIINID